MLAVIGLVAGVAIAAIPGVASAAPVSAVATGVDLQAVGAG